MSWSIPHAISSPLLRVARCRSARGARRRARRSARAPSRRSPCRGAGRRCVSPPPWVTSSEERSMRDGGVERDDLVVEGGEVAVLERREPARAHAAAGGPAASRTRPRGASTPVCMSSTRSKREHARGREVERLAVDEQADDRAVGGADDRLAGPRQPVGVLGIDDRPGLVEAVEDRAGVVRRAALLGRAADAEVAVADREDRLRAPVLGWRPCSTISHSPAAGQAAERAARAGARGGRSCRQLPEVGDDEVGARRAQLGGARRCARRRSRGRSRRRGRRRRPRARPRPRRRGRAGRRGGRRRRGSRRGRACRAGRGAGCRGRRRSARRGRRCRRRAGPRRRSRSRSPRRSSTPARRSRSTQATEPGKASTPSRASARSTSACLRLPMPCTDHSSAGLSALPSGASMPRARRKSRTPS